jgi:cardiolipin synthase
MELLIQPEHGFDPILAAIKTAESSVDIVIFRADMKELQKALDEAAQRGIQVNALVAHTNRGGEKRLRKLELALLQAGITVTRTGDDLVRYHGKMMIVDRQTLYVLGFNFTALDVFKSRSFGIVTKDKTTVGEALRLFESDKLRQPYVPESKTLIVSPENSRMLLAAFLKSAKNELLIYDPKIADGPMIRLLNERNKAGVKIRILGKVTSKGTDLAAEKLPKLRLHVRAILKDNTELFVGSQSLRSMELDRRREVGLVVGDAKAIKQFRTTFEADWALTDLAKDLAKQEEKARDDDKKPKKDEPKNEDATRRNGTAARSA